MRQPTRIATAVGALVVLVSIVVGIPAALIALVGWPVPSPLPTTDELGDMLVGRAPVPTDLAIAGLAIVMWVLWVQVVWAVAVEVTAALRGHLARRTRVLPGVQLTVAKLVTSATLLTSGLAPRPAAVGALLPVAAVTQVDPGDGDPAEPGPGSGLPNASERTGPEVRAYITEPGDTWWEVAESTFGTGTRWKEIRNLNLGRTMDDGFVISVGTDLLRPNWRLLLPVTASQPGGTNGREVVVAAGDTIWALAEADLEYGGRASSIGRVAEHTNDMVDLNVEQIGDDPDLIHPGQRLRLPPLPPLAPRAPAAAPGSGGAAAETSTGPLSPGGELDVGVDAEHEADADVDALPGADAELDVDAQPGAETDVDAQPDAEVAPSADAVTDAGADPDPDVEPGAGPVADADADPVVDSGAEVDPAAVVEPGGPDGGRSPLAGMRARSTPQPMEVPATADGPVGSPTVESSAEIADEATSGRSELSPLPPPAQTPTQRPALGPTADLPTGAVLDADQGLADDPRATEPTLDTALDRAPVFVGLAGLTLVGAYLHRARRRRRKTVLQSRHPGRRPQSSKRRVRTVARRMAAAAEMGHPEFLNLSLRALGRLLRDWSPESLPRISGVWLSHNRLVLALADDSPRRSPPAPFTPFADGSGWSLLRSRADEIRTIARGANGPLPLLTTVGTTTALDLALTTNSRAPADAYGLASSLLFAVDLEVGRVISVVDRTTADRAVSGGPPATVVEAMTTMAIELATSETADQAEIVCVGFGHRLATFERVMVVDRLSEVIDDLEEVADRALSASLDATPFATRVGDGAADTWNPVVVFHLDPTDPDAEALVDLSERSEGGVTAVCGYPTQTGWAFVVDGERVSCPDLPGNLAQHAFERPDPGDLGTVSELFEELPEIELDDRFWAPLEPEADRPDRPDRPDRGEDRIGRGADEADPIDPAAEEPWPDQASWHSMARVGEGTASTGEASADEREPEPVPAALLRHSVEVPSADHRPNESPSLTPRAPIPEPTEVQRNHDRDHDPQPVTPFQSPSGPRLYVVGRPGPGSAAGASPGPDDAGRPAPDDDQASEVRVSVLGPFTVNGHHIGDRAKPWKYTKTAELILYLLLNPGGASQDLLMEELFPEQPPNRPRLNQLVSDARTKALGRDPNGDYHLPHASPTDPFYRLSPSVAFDLRDFGRHCARARQSDDRQIAIEEWTTALELVDGRPFDLPHDGYEWALPEIEATVVKVEEAAMALADLAIERHDYRLAVWATKKGLLTGTGYYELLAKRGRAALLLEDPEEIVRAFADLQLLLDSGGAPEEGTPDLSGHPDLAGIYHELSNGGRGRDQSS